MKNQGQISMMALATIGTSILIAVFGSVSYANRNSSSKIDVVNSDLTTTKVNIASLQAQIPDISRRLDGIEKQQTTQGNDIKEILRLVK